MSNARGSFGDFDCMFCGKCKLQYPHECILKYSMARGFFYENEKQAAVAKIKRMQFYNGAQCKC